MPSSLMFSAQRLAELNQPLLAEHHTQLQQLSDSPALRTMGVPARLVAFRVAIPSWAPGTGGTRFGRFAGGGEPATLEDKIHDVAAVRQQLQATGLTIDSVNSNTFRNQAGQAASYKYGSLAATDEAARVVQHNVDGIDYGQQPGARVHPGWLADGPRERGLQSAAASGLLPGRPGLKLPAAKAPATPQ